MIEAELHEYSAPLSALRDTYAGGDPAWPPISDLNYDPIHRLVLDLSRCCFAGQASDSAAPCAFALGEAMQAIGIDAGPVLFARVMAVAQSIAAERQRDFACMTVHCARITPDEQALMNAVALARIGVRGARLLRAAMAVAETDACPATFGTLEMLGAECANLEATGPLAQVCAQARTAGSAH